MKLNLSIEYKTAWGEELVLCLEGKRYPLAYVADGLWQGEIARFNPEKTAQYSYEVVRDGYTVRKEWKKHTLALPAGIEPKEITVVDRWIDRPYDSPFYSSAFTQAIFGRKAEKAKKAMKDAGMDPVEVPIRGGTDGARLSFMGLPCPNIFAGGMNFHGKFEYCSLNTMKKAEQVIINLAQLWAE